MEDRLNPLPTGIASRHIDGINGLRVHILEVGAGPDRPLLLLLHGFPELAYSWRKVMGPLAEAGFHVVAPDQRGYGRTTGWSDAYDQDLAPFSMLHLASDARTLVQALGHDRVAAVIGHDFGSPVAAWCALTRPDVFPAVVLMSAPFAGAPMAANDGQTEAVPGGLSRLARPRVHYHWYYATRQANDDMWRCPEGVHAFLRAYFHMKSADWPENRPYRLAGWTAEALSELPTYYVMDAGTTMAEAVRPHHPTAQQVAACSWMPDAEMAVYAAEFGRTGFQGGLNWYRTRFDSALNGQLALYAGRQIEVPAMFIGGAQDWGIHQVPGSLERMQTHACRQMADCHLVPDAGHWVMQEQPAAVAALLLDFLKRVAPSRRLV
jgi:pimeloyl-ACP methyl ester carboxylesterase